ncbi:unnamed protein product [Paramecium sonneborni]|uniref:Uncharacterized protein n=1 Tax=Paramecium sonneborni TaxID=65129 RepID=A0A8S1R118_9CILI|nr:unnamed protein product [Paramecium sonneborni]
MMDKSSLIIVWLIINLRLNSHLSRELNIGTQVFKHGYKHAFMIDINTSYICSQCLLHGFLIAYYVFFIKWAIFNEITKQVERAKDKFKFIPFTIQRFICGVYGQLAVNSTATPIGLLKWEKVYKAMNDFGWVALIVMVVWVFFKITKFGQGKKKE